MHHHQAIAMNLSVVNNVFGFDFTIIQKLMDYKYNLQVTSMIHCYIT